MADLARTALEESRRMSEPDLRSAVTAYRLIAQVFEDEADLRLD
jgi:hypothetical protein